MHMTSNPQAASEAYCIAAVDSCKKLSPMSPEHKTIYLSPPVINACADKISLQWTSYINMSGPGLKGYRVMVSENGGPFTLLADLSPSVTTYEQTALVNGYNYCYFIQAYDSLGQKTSSSNRHCTVVEKPNQPKFVYLRYATVKDDEYVQLGFFVDTAAYITRFKILRSTDDVFYDTIAVLPPDNAFANLEYNDVSVDVHEKSYYYKIIVSDSCFIDVLTSNIGRTIYLEGNVDDYMSNYISWNNYEGRTAQAHNVFREVEQFEPYTKVQSLVMNETFYTDDVGNYTESGGRFNYMIQAPLMDVFDSVKIFRDTVYSNELMLLQPPRLYVPNAFFPDGLNSVFKPVGVFTDKENYNMIIYDRWGQKVFETIDYETGWDGTCSGKKCPFAVYTYYIKITNAFNKTFIKRGIVTLVR